MSISSAVFLDRASVYPDDLDLNALQQSVAHWQWLDNARGNEITRAVARVDVVVSNKVVLDASVLAQAEKLKLICVAATGTNNVDLAAAREKNIVVCNVRAYATASVVQHVFSLLLALTRKLPAYQQAVSAGRWVQSEFFCLLDFPIRELQGLTLGIVGYGELGQAVAKLAEAFGMKVLIARRNRQDHREGRIDLHKLLPQVDVLSLHCPLTADNKGLIGEKELSLMKPDALLINTARGGLVDEKALLQALQENRLGGAGLDVLAQEPPAADFFLLQQSSPNLIITPHIAWASRQARQRLVDEIANNILAYKRGEARNTV